MVANPFFLVQTFIKWTRCNTTLPSAARRASLLVKSGACYAVVCLNTSCIDFRLAYGLLVTESETRPSSLSEFWLHVSVVKELENVEEIGSFNIKLTSATRNFTRKPQFFLQKAKNNLDEIYIFRSTSWFYQFPFLSHYLLLVSKLYWNSESQI